MSLKIGEIKKVANCHEVLVDIDDKTIFTLEETQDLLDLIELCGLTWKTYHMEPSSSGTGTHVIIEVFEKLRPIEQIAVQAILGSDPKREALNFRRKGKWNVLFASKHEISTENKK